MSESVITYISGMARWEPNARSRLAQAALELYVQRGYEQTTVADIAEQAGLTERTFFRHFADKREVLFAGGDHLREALVTALDGVPDTAAPLDAVAAALEAVVPFFADREWSKKRQAIITANPELQERELIKLASLASALADGLRRRGIKDPAASVAAEAGIAAFRVAFERWVTGAKKRDLTRLIKESIDELKALAAGA
jgi:AcrR family transcriptional regulator